MKEFMQIVEWSDDHPLFFNENQFEDLGFTADVDYMGFNLVDAMGKLRVGEMLKYEEPFNGMVYNVRLK